MVATRRAWLSSGNYYFTTRNNNCGHIVQLSVYKCVCLFELYSGY